MGAFCPAVCMVVKVVARERTDGAGDEKVLSALRPFAVQLVPATDDTAWEGAVTDRDVSCSVETVGAIDRPPSVGGGKPSVDILTDSARASVSIVEVLPLRPEDTE